jgi:hypothetical protein
MGIANKTQPHLFIKKKRNLRRNSTKPVKNIHCILHILEIFFASSITQRESCPAWYSGHLHPQRREESGSIEKIEPIKFRQVFKNPVDSIFCTF